MSRRCFAQPSLTDAFVKTYSRGGGFLEDISKTFDWGPFAVLFAQINGAVKGAPGFPLPVMFKIMLLQQWYNLSASAAEEAVRDSLSFSALYPRAARSGDAGPCLDLAVPADHREAGAFRDAF